MFKHILRHFSWKNKKKSFQKARSLIKCFGYLIHVMSQVMYQHTPILLLRFTCVKCSSQKNMCVCSCVVVFFIYRKFSPKTSTFSFATRFLLGNVAVHYFIFPIQQSLRQCWRFTQVRFTLLCIFANNFHFLTNSFTTTTTRQVCLYYYGSPSHVCTQTERKTHHIFIRVIFFFLSHHGAYSLIITISIYSIHKTVYSNFQKKTVKRFYIKFTVYSQWNKEKRKMEKRRRRGSVSGKNMWNQSSLKICI